MTRDTLKRNLKNVQGTTITLIKIFLFLALFAIFFGLFSIDNPQITAITRTAAITMSTFVILGISMTAVYGGFAIGKKKSKDIISSLGIATFITDVITYFQLCIMNTNRFNSQMFSFTNVGVLIAVIVLQILIICVFVYIGNYLYFKINPPEECVIVCGNLDEASELLHKVGRYKKQYHVSDVIHFTNENVKPLIRHSDSVFLYHVPAQQKNEIIDYAYKHYTNIYFNTELADVVINYSKHIVVDDLSMLSSNIKGLSLEQKTVKRLLDIVVAAIALLAASPIMLIECIAIKVGDRGPVFFKQERLTKDGRKFNVLKFRTMIVNAEKNNVAVLSSKNDSRITPVGKILRATRMDELPQFFNVLFGDMSIVGPRPERESIALEYYKEIPEFKYRLRAKAGLTGLAQIAGKYNTTPKDKLILDLMYIEKYSVWADILIIFQTLKIFFKSDSTEGFDSDKIVEFKKYEPSDIEEKTKSK